jgi:hypothetical protein
MPAPRAADQRGHLLTTKQGVVIGKPTHPLWSLGNGTTVDIVGAKPETLDAYICDSRPQSVTSLARFLATLLLTPRAEVAHTRGDICAAFEGYPAPALTFDRYMEAAPASAVGPGAPKTVLNALGAREMATIHIAAVRRVRDQVLPALIGQIRPKLASTGMPECPFGLGCLYHFYGLFLHRLISIVRAGHPEQATSFILHFQPGQGPIMHPAPVTEQYCTCPYRHREDDNAPTLQRVDLVLAKIRQEARGIIWRLANEAEVAASEASVVLMQKHTKEVVVAAFDALTESAANGFLAFSMVASIDNVADRLLVEPARSQPHRAAWGQVHQAPIYLDLQKACIEQLVGPWENPNILPYMAHYSWARMLSLSRAVTQIRAPKPEEIEGARVAWERARAPEAAAPVLAPPVDVVKSSPGLTAHALAPPSPLSTVDGPAPEEEEPEHPPLIGIKEPQHGRRCIPRVVSDAYLDKEGFSFYTYASLDIEAQDNYVFDKLEHLYDTYIPNLDRDTLRSIAAEQYRRCAGDPYLLFDCGYAYGQIIAYLTQVASDPV